MDTRALKSKVRSIHRLLIKEYGLPIKPAWAGTTNPIDSAAPDRMWQPIEPVDELINTILSQNTNDLNRDKAYRGLRSIYPTWEQVRDAGCGQDLAAHGQRSPVTKTPP
jgi:endonuclease III